jgi:lipopolysaccharide biosynthesis protein
LNVESNAGANEKSTNRIRAIAFHLPQFHPIPENDEWWGKGFTEWTNTAKAKPLFRGHYQPHIPADLGFYDLRLAESRTAQATLAKSAGLEGFCYYHYWFGGGKMLLSGPVSEILRLGEPDFGFCLCWANQTWTGVWHGAPNRTLMEQTYPGEMDHRNHFEYLLPAFRDNRYIKVDGKPVFIVYKPTEIPDVKKVMNLWRQMAENAGLKGLHLIGVGYSDWIPQELGFDASVNPQLPTLRPNWVSWRTPFKKLLNEYQKRKGLPTIYSYEAILPYLLKRPSNSQVENYPCVIPNWDNTPRSKSNGLVLLGSTPELFRRHFRDAIAMSQDLPDGRKFIFIKSWNEWAEGNHLEPDLKFGLAYLNVVAEELSSYKL